MKPTRLLALALLALVALAPAAHAQDWAKAAIDTSPRHREWVTIKSGSRNLQAYVVYPEVSTKAPVVVLIHEIFGLSDWAREMADEVAGEGYIVVEPDLLSGFGPPPGAAAAAAPDTAMDHMNMQAAPGASYHPRQLILLGASTGGTEALKEVLTRLPQDLPGICVVQHIPPHFSRAFADRLNALCDLEVREAVDGDLLKPGLVLVAPGDFHMTLKWIGQGYRIHLNKEAQVWHQRPAVDILFDSAVEAGAGPYSVGCLFTGMGKDGASGLLHLREHRAATYAQNEETCVVFGMPRAAMELNAADQMLPLLDFPQTIISSAYRLARRSQSAASGSGDGAGTDKTPA